MNASTRLTGQRVLVLGATGNVGHGAAIAMLDAGATVLAPTRTARGAEALATTFAGRPLQPLVGDISDPIGAAQLADAIASAGPVDHVFASLGPWWQGGRIADQDPAEWTRVRAMLLDGHVHAAEVLLPMLEGRDGASYTIVTGMGAHHVMAGTSLLFVATGGVLSLSKVLRAEYEDGRVRVNELLISARIEKDPRPGVIEAAQLGRTAVEIATGEQFGQIVRFPRAG